MLAFLLLLTMAITDAESPPVPGGTIQGVVVNGTQNNEPLEGVEVLLRAGTDGALIPVAETKTDRYGKFSFAQVPLDPTLEYLPGANRDGVHYPGRRVRLDSSDRVASVNIVVFDAVKSPCTLVAKQHDIDIVVEQRTLKVTERLLIANPTSATYVGQSMGHGPPVTLLLSIPQNFDRVTFDKEFYGRQFYVVEHRPVTEIPWLPGEQELRFTYRVPLVESAGQFRRLLDLPSTDVRISLHGADARQVSCNLPRSKEPGDQLTFASVGEQLAQGFSIEMQLKSLPFPWMQYARWGAVVVLVLLAGATITIPLLRRRLSTSRAPSKRRASPKQQRAA
jgi:hypothetical protein